MRVAQAIALYAPEFRGGATLVCERLTRELAARGHVVDVFSGRTTAAEPLGEVRREPVGDALTWRVNVGGAFDPWSRENWDNPVAGESFAAFLAATRPDVVHAHSVQALGVGVLEGAAAAGLPVVWTMHDWWWLCPCLFRLSPARRPCPPLVRPERCARRPEYDFAARRARLDAALATAARVVTPSAYLRDSLIANGLDADRVVVQENGIEPPAASSRSRRDLSGSTSDAGEAANALRVVYVGGAGNREKGLAVLLDAACRIERPDFELRCHAVDPVEAGDYARRLGARLRCLPRFEPDEIDAILADADVVVVPSLMRESFSLVTREALVRGVPVIAADCGGPEEVIRPGENGLIVPTGSAAALAAALARLIADRKELARLAAARRVRVPTPSDQARSAERLYRDVLREAAARREPSAPARHGRTRPHALDGRRIVFLTGIDGAPLRYRVWHLVEQLAGRGAGSRVLYHSDVAALEAARAADLVVLYRAPYSVTVAAVVADARRRRVPVVFSCDDLVFCAEDCDAPALRDARPGMAAGFRWTLDAYGRSLAIADCFLGSTEELVAAARECGVPSFLHRNGLGSPLAARAERARENRAAAREDLALAGERNGSGDATSRRVRLGFFSGTDTHDGDLAQIAPALARVLARFPSTRLAVGGPVALPAELTAFEDRVEREPLVPWSDLPDRLAGLDVNLAPLELPSRFNEAKSEVKYLEAALVGVPTVASPSLAFRFATGDGDSGLLARTEDEWETALARLIEDPDLRARLGRAARRDAYRRYSPLVQDGDAAEIFDEMIERGSSRNAKPKSPVPMEAGGGSNVALEPSNHPYDAYQLIAESGGPLGPGREVEQSFTCRGDGLFRVDVMVGTYARENPHDVDLAVLDEAGEVLGRRRLGAVTLLDRSFVSVELDRPLADSAGRTLRVRAEAPGACGGNEILLWNAPARVGELRIGGDLVPGRAIAFRSFGEEAA